MIGHLDAPHAVGTSMKAAKVRVGLENAVRSSPDFALFGSSGLHLLSKVDRSSSCRPSCLG
jgi:hypothetical protein